MERRREVRPSLARAISRRDSSMAVDVRTAMICSGGIGSEGGGGWRLREA